MSLVSYRALLAAGCAVSFAAHAQAQVSPEVQSAGVNSQEIVVTAQKREERLLDVPQSVSVISPESLQAVHADRIADYFTRIPSATFVEAQAGQGRLVLRGINTGGVGASVATYVDETPYGSTTALANGAVLAPDIDPFDLQRIEVLRGPQGTLYGANSLGGLVKYVTVLPQTDALHFAAEAGFESVSQGNTGYSGRAAINLPVASTVAIRVSGFYRTDPSFIDDVLKGSDVNDAETYGGRASILLQPTENFTLRGSIFVENLFSNGSNNYDGDPVTLAPTLGELKTRRVVSEPNRVKYRIYNITGEFDMGAVSLLSSSSLGTLDERLVSDASGLYGPLLTSIFETPLGVAIVGHLEQRRFTQELRLASSGKQMFEWTLGGYYSEERNQLDQSLDAVSDPDGGAVPGFDGLQLVGLGSRYKEVAGFASGTFHFSPKFDLTLGGRYSHNKQSVVQTGSGPLAGGDSSVSGTSSENVFTYSIAPSFKPNANTTFYARVAKGYRPGGPNIIPPAAPTAVPRQFGSDTTTSYEVGVKAELLDRKLSVELSGFYIDWQNIQLLVDVGGFGVNTNAGGARSKGIEFTATLTPVTGLTLNANGAYVEAELTSAGSPFSGGVKGDRLPYSPKFSSTVSVEYGQPLSDSVEGTLGMSWRYTGDRDSGFDPASGQTRLPAYSQVDAHAGVTFNRFRLDAFVRNLTDSRGITNLGTAGSALDGAISVAVIRPRSFGLSLGVRY